MQKFYVCRFYTEKKNLLHEMMGKEGEGGGGWCPLPPSFLFNPVLWTYEHMFQL